MALVTVQRTPSGVSSPQSSASESGGPEEEDSGKTGIRSLSECYFAGKGTVLMLGSNERLGRSSATPSHLTSLSSESPQNRSISNMSHASDFTTTVLYATMSPTNRSASREALDDNAVVDESNNNSSNSSNSGGNDIQKHLQSMFYLLRPEETLKMAVKLESIRAGRTRYLVVVSRPVKRKKQASHHNTTSQQTSSHKQPCASSPPANNQQHTEEPCIVCTKSENNENNCDSIKPPSSLPLETTTTTLTFDSGGEFCFNCRKNSSLAVELKTKADNEEEVEESCLLGIDCNEETTVGLVLRVLADTTIRLDGDG